MSTYWYINGGSSWSKGDYFRSQIVALNYICKCLSSRILPETTSGQGNSHVRIIRISLIVSQISCQVISSPHFVNCFSLVVFLRYRVSVVGEEDDRQKSRVGGQSFDWNVKINISRTHCKISENNSMLISPYVTQSLCVSLYDFTISR